MTPWQKFTSYSRATGDKEILVTQDAYAKAMKLAPRFGDMADKIAAALKKHNSIFDMTGEQIFSSHSRGELFWLWNEYIWAMVYLGEIEGEIKPL